jgi:hypothetical protein
MPKTGGLRAVGVQNFGIRQPRVPSRGSKLSKFSVTSMSDSEDPRRTGIALPRNQSVSVSVAVLLLGMESVTPLGAVTVAVSEIEPGADALIVPIAL